MAVGFRGAAARMTTAALAAAAQAHGYELAVLEAVLDVESSGSGYDAAGRPKILPEPHVFYRLLAHDVGKQAAAVKAGVAYPNQGMKPYPVGSDANYARLAVMCGIDETAALQATSWGCAQVMGFNFATCGYSDVQAMVAAALDSEVSQFAFLLRYAEHEGLETALRTKAWATFARGYNGPGAVAVYAGKLAAAYARHQGEGPAVPPVAAAPALRQAPSTTDALNDAEWLRIRGGQS